MRQSVLKFINTSTRCSHPQATLVHGLHRPDVTEFLVLYRVLASGEHFQIVTHERVPLVPWRGQQTVPVSAGMMHRHATLNTVLVHAVTPLDGFEHGALPSVAWSV